MNGNIKFRFRLKSKEDSKIITIYTELYNPDYFNDILQCPIDLNEWEVLSIDRFTGLKDRLSNSIYENDIIASNNSSHYIKSIVHYKNGAFTRSYNNGNIYLLYDGCIENGIMLDFEMIGNIYDNKELIK